MLNASNQKLRKLLFIIAQAVADPLSMKWDHKQQPAQANKEQCLCQGQDGGRFVLWLPKAALASLVLCWLQQQDRLRLHGKALS